MKLLDLFCGAGGAGYGYYLAGFQVTGVDLSPQPRYPFRFIQGDALEYAQLHGHEYDVIHASPPCQHYSRTRTMNARYSETADLVGPVRDILRLLGQPYVIENVPGAPLESPTLLCGQMFGLRVLRERLFESNQWLWQLPHVKHTDYLPFLHKREREYADAMGCFWMGKTIGRQAVPPAYTEYIGRQLFQQLCHPFCGQPCG